MPARKRKPATKASKDTSKKQKDEESKAMDVSVKAEEKEEKKQAPEEQKTEQKTSTRGCPAGGKRAPKDVQETRAPHTMEEISAAPNGKLVLDDGTEYVGYSFGADTSIAGEVVFNTGMVGYPESLTDPSYKGQILVITYPLIGNYGVPDDSKDEFGLSKHFESDQIQVSALIITDYSGEPSHWTSNRSLGNWLKAHNVPALFAMDTRQLTKKIRVKGAMLGKVLCSSKDVEFEDPNLRNLVAEVSRKKAATYGHGKFKILALDCGIKNNIIRYLVSKGIELKVVPWDADLEKENFDGLFVSNGPGDPTQVQKTIDSVKKQLERKDAVPIFGICLGNQIMALAAGAKTYKMKFGNRGMNQPCIDLRTNLCYITPQNHGFAVDNKSLPKDWQPLFVNANDHTNEGLIHSYQPFFSVQFHPEAQGGPTDTEFLFDTFLDRVKDKRNVIQTIAMPPPIPAVTKVILLGSGGLSIGQAGEFDYSGSQAIKALKEENIYTILINPNIATVQTSAGMADKVYFLPVTADFVEDVIKKEKPDGILLQFGGQTALNCGIDLYDSGVLERHNVKVLGTPVETIRATEDREIFAQKLDEINEHVAPSKCATNAKDALAAATEIGFPGLVRAAFALGGLGSGFAKNEEEFNVLVRKALGASPQVIIDKSLRGWKEVEYEVVRDGRGNCITVCNMENFDPLGIHTGDSIVVAPSQTLSNKEYFALRKTAIKVIKHLGVVGECNIQYALDPKSERYCIIEVNARLSRSSALASKATGYPLAYVAAKLAMGLCLTDIKNSVTKITQACFEPSLDYLVVKIPRWDMRKFNHVSADIGSSMKSVGEVMAIGRTFEETFQKAIRMIDDSIYGFGDSGAFNQLTNAELEHQLSNPSDIRVFLLAVAFHRNYSVNRLYELTFIDHWFLCKLRKICDIDHCLRAFSGPITKVPRNAILTSKRYGFADKHIANCLGSTEIEVRAVRKAHGITPWVKQVDTLAAEFPAQTNYLYVTYNGHEHDVDFSDKGVMVLGCGAYRIGSSCEFDWCAVSCLRTLRKLGHKSVMVNYNPETVSTDYDECDRLYFEELSLERVLDIYEAEMSSGVVVSVGGQIPNNLSLPLSAQGVNILGTSPESIDNAEDRSKFSALLDRLGVDQPRWKALTTMDEAKKFAEEVGYPCLVRPSYVLSGAAMNVAASPEELEAFLTTASDLSSEHPVVISKFIMGAKEIEYDGVASKGTIVNYAISEHIENAGVHSGDASLVLPAQKLYVETIKRIKKISSKIAKALKISGPFNIQYLSVHNDIKVIECNLRASRSFPFVSKTFNVNFVEIATKVFLNSPVRSAVVDLFDVDHVSIKVPMFSFTRLQGADPVLRVEMASTGEVACYGSSIYECYLKAMLSTGFKLPKKAILISIGNTGSKIEFLDSARALSDLGYTLYGSAGTAKFFLQEGGVKMTVLHKPSAKKSPAIVDYLKEGKIDLVINQPLSNDPVERTDGYHVRRCTVDFNIPLISNIKCAILMAQAMEKMNVRPGSTHSDLKWELLSWTDYMQYSNML